MTTQSLRDSIARHRDQTATPLRLNLRLDRLLDEDRCRLLSQDLRRWSDGNGWEIRSATQNLGKMLPSVPGVYMFVWRPPMQVPMAAPKRDIDWWCVLYVGQAGADGGAGTLQARFANEYRRYIGRDAEQLWRTEEPTTRAQRLSRFFNLEELEYWYAVVENTAHIRDLESRLIRIFNPPLNDQGAGPVLRALEPVKAF